MCNDQIGPNKKSCYNQLKILFQKYIFEQKVAKNQNSSGKPNWIRITFEFMPVTLSHSMVFISVNSFGHLILRFFVDILLRSLASGTNAWPESMWSANRSKKSFNIKSNHSNPISYLVKNRHSSTNHPNVQILCYMLCVIVLCHARIIKWANSRHCNNSAIFFVYNKQASKLK